MPQDSNQSQFVTRAQGRRKSRFPAKDAVDSAAYMDFFLDGVNWKIPYQDFVNGLNVTGSIVQTGAVTGLPVLDVQGDVNNIRNIEIGAGISGAISPENGISLATNFGSGVTGTQVLIDETTNPFVRSLNAGSGINLDVAGDAITISNSQIQAQSQQRIIFDVDDFPTPVGGEILLAPDTNYVLVNSIVTDNSFVLQDRTSMTSGSPVTISLEYTGVNPMFKTTTGNLGRVDNLTLICNNAPLVECTGGNFFMLTSSITADSLGSVTDMSYFSMRNMFFPNIATNGLTFSGTNGICAIDDWVGDFNGTLFDLGSASFDDLTITDSFLNFPSGGTFLSGLTNSGNVNPNRLATCENLRLPGATIPLVNISSNDDRWGFVFVDKIKDTNRLALSTLSNNATATVLTVAGTPELVAGTWAMQELSGYTADAAGRITYTQSQPRDASITVGLSAFKTGGGADTYTFFIGLNGVVIPETATSFNLPTSSNPLSITLVWAEALAENDFLEIFVQGDGTTDDVTVQSAQFRVT